MYQFSTFPGWQEDNSGYQTASVSLWITSEPEYCFSINNILGWVWRVERDHSGAKVRKQVIQTITIAVAKEKEAQACDGKQWDAEHRDINYRKNALVTKCIPTPFCAKPMPDSTYPLFPCVLTLFWFARCEVLQGGNT